MAMTLYATNIYSNDGIKLLWSGSFENSLTCEVTSTGISFVRGDQFTGDYGYGGSGTFLGVSTSSGASTPIYAVGTTFYTATSTLNLYIVESGGGSSGGGSGVVTIQYGNQTLYSGTSSKILQCSGKLMNDDVTVSITNEPFQTYYTGSGAPSSSLGSVGDIYLQTS